jgi:hypothetical protein
MFDRLAWRRKSYGRDLPGLDDEEKLDDEDADHYDTPMGELARIADDVEAGRIKLPPRWRFDRPSPGVQVWTTPSGRRFAFDPAGELLPLPDGEAPFRSWTSR